MKAWILEINDNPSLYIFLEKDFMGGGGEKFLSEVDLQVKKKCFGDALSITSTIFRNNNMSLESYKSYRKLDLDGEVLQTFYLLLGLFEHVTTIKNRRFTSLGGISKLCSKVNIKGNISKTDITFLFQKHIKESKNDFNKVGDFMDFTEFCFFVCVRLKNFMAQKGKIDVNMTAYEFINVICC